MTQAVSTSDDPSLVGSLGDVFIGQSTNLIFGKARQVGFNRNHQDEQAAAELGVKEVKMLYGEPTGDFQHNPEPLEKNLGDIMGLMKVGNHDVAFVVDPDGVFVFVQNQIVDQHSSSPPSSSRP